MVTPRNPDPGEIVLAEEFHEGLGGKGLNSAIAAHRASRRNPAAKENATVSEPKQLRLDSDPTLRPAIGDDSASDMEVRMVGAVGDDRHGDQFREVLEQNGMDTSGLIVIPNMRSHITFVTVEQYSGDNRCLAYPGATGSWRPEQFKTVESLGYGERPDLVIVSMAIGRKVVQQVVETAGRADVELILNAAPGIPITTRHYRYVTHLLVNETEIAIMSGREVVEVNRASWPQIAREFLNRGVKNFVLTLGTRGAFYATPRDQGHIPGFKVRIVDTTGASDTFNGAYAVEYLRQKAAGHWDIRKAIIRANKAVAIFIGKLGSQQGIPWADELDAFEAELLPSQSYGPAVLEPAIH